MGAPGSGGLPPPPAPQLLPRRAKASLTLCEGATVPSAQPTPKNLSPPQPHRSPHSTVWDPLPGRGGLPSLSPGSGPSGRPRRTCKRAWRHHPPLSSLPGGLRARLCPQHPGLKSHRPAVPTHTQPEGPGTLPYSASSAPPLPDSQGATDPFHPVGGGGAGGWDLREHPAWVPPSGALAQRNPTLPIMWGPRRRKGPLQPAPWGHPIPSQS